MKTLKRSRTSARERRVARTAGLATGRRAAAQPGRLGKLRAHAGWGIRNRRPPKMRGQAQRVVASGRGREPAAPQLIFGSCPARRGASGGRPPFRWRTLHARSWNKLTQLKTGACSGVTNITFQVSGQRRGSCRGMGPRPVSAVMQGVRHWVAETKEFAAQHRLRPLRHRTALDRIGNCIYKRGIGFAAHRGRRALPQTFVRMKTADGHWGTTGQQPVRELAIDMPARPARSTGEQ